MILQLCLVMMQDYGQGYCVNGFYAGWDGMGHKSEEECKNLCLEEEQCTFAAYYPGGGWENGGYTTSCSRYNEATCPLDKSTNGALDHKAFIKTGKGRKVVNVSKSKKVIVME